jgi:hypothetical protein
VARRALILANGHFADSRIPPLASPVPDGRRLADLLKREDVGAYEVEFGADLSAPEVRLRTERFFNAAGADDLLVLFLSGHGMKDRKGNLHFVTKDTQRDALAATAVDARFFHERMKDSLARRLIVFVDTCYSGAFAEGGAFKSVDVAVEKRDFTSMGDGIDEEGVAIFTASARNQLAQEGEGEDGQTQSRFTEALIEGIETGAADPQGSGVITLDNLFRFARTRLRAAGIAQTPQQLLSKLPGTVPVARNPAAAVTLPEALLADLDGTDRVKRVAAIDELLTLARGPNMVLGRMARSRLEALTQDEMVSVSTAAARAIEKLGPDPHDDGEAAAARAMAEAEAEAARIRADAEAKARAEQARLRAEAEAEAARIRAEAEAEGEARRRRDAGPKSSGGGWGKWVAIGVGGFLTLGVIGALVEKGEQTTPPPEPPPVNDGGFSTPVERRLDLGPGADVTDVTETVSGDETHDWLADLSSGQMLSIKLTPPDAGGHFDLFRPGAAEPTYSGTDFAAVIDESGTWRVRVHLDRGPAASGAVMSYRLSVAQTNGKDGSSAPASQQQAVAPPPPVAAPPPGAAAEDPVAAEVAAYVRQLSPMLPQRVNEVTTWTGVRAEGRHLRLLYTLDGPIDPASVSQVQSNLAAIVTPFICSDAGMVAFMGLGGSLTAEYTGSNGVSVEVPIRCR